MLQDGRCRPGFVPLARPSLQLTLVWRAAAWRYMRVARMRGETIYGALSALSSPLVIPVGKGPARQVYGFVSTLPHCSAHAVVSASTSATPDFLEDCVGCFKRLGGVPEKFVVDDSSIVETRRPRTPGGEMSMISGQPRMASLLAVGDVRTLSIDGSRFERILAKRPEVASR